MKIDITSDLHADFFIQMSKGNKEKQLKNYMKIMYNKDHIDSDVLIIAGDISHYNSLTKQLLEYILEHRNHKKIFFVLGNHDYYLISKSIKHKYKNNSKNRVNEIKEMFLENDNIHFLDGSIVEYQETRFGGTSSFYDGSYGYKVSPMFNSLSEWKRVMNDSVYIKGYEDFYNILIEEKPKLEAIYKDSDVIVTHVNPMPHAKFFEEKYRMNTTTGFYCFDGEYQVQHTPAKVWIHGHTHSPCDIEVYNTRIIRNPLGYPGEEGYCKVKSIDI